jgi:hypothetical protein
MPINPIAFRNIDLPPNPIFTPINFAPLGEIGTTIGRYRDQQEIGRLLQGAIDPKTGQLDFNRAATALATSGRDPGEYLRALTAQGTLGIHAMTARSTMEHQREMERIARETMEQGKVTRGVVTEEGPQGDVHRAYELGPKGFRWLEAPATPATSAPAATAPGPQSAAEPEEAPPYQVAGPPTAAPTASPAAAPAPAVPTAPPASTGPDVAVTPSFKAQRQELGKKTAEIQAEQVKDAKAAADLQPLLDDVVNSWEKLSRFRREGVNTALGPVVGSDIGRAPTKLFGGSEEERLRHTYEQALNTLKAQATAAFNKGQGAVSNYERQLYAAIFPGFTTTNPEYDLAYLRQMQDKSRQTAKLGRETEIGKQVPSYLTERPKIERPESAPRAVASETEANRLIGQARAALQRDPTARDKIIGMMRERGIRNPELFLGQ